jgi:hypothetical protein
MTKLSFGKISVEDLVEYFEISQENEILQFGEIDISSEVEKKLADLIKKNRNYIEDYLEEELKMLFIAPILNLVDFQCGEFRAWLERDFQFEFEKVLLYGKPDFMVARGDFKPEKPFFFLQEYKKSLPNVNPKWQLIAEMIVSLSKGGISEVFGSYVIGQYWHFVKLWKSGNEIKFSISESFDSLKISDLKSIYGNLRYIKGLHCK